MEFFFGGADFHLAGSSRRNEQRCYEETSRTGVQLFFVQQVEGVVGFVRGRQRVDELWLWWRCFSLSGANTRLVWGLADLYGGKVFVH